MIYDIAVIGAGASGLMAASQLKDKQICVIDTNKDIGAKIKISGGSKCNITNKYLDETHYLGDNQFIKKTFQNFNQYDLLEFLNSNGIFPKIDEKIVKGTYFCKSSNEIIDMFKRLTKHVHYKLGTVVKDVEESENIFIIKTSREDVKTKKLIVASGGLSYPSLGASDIGLKIAEKFGHNIIKTNPALVGFTVQKDQFWFKELSGLSLDVKIKVENKIIEGKLLFTHKGCSGPAVLTTSLYWKKGNIIINFTPSSKTHLPKRFKQIAKYKNISIDNYIMAPAGNFGYTKAEVTRGGVDISELTMSMESKIKKNLYFLGEVADVTGELGGYNFQWAFSSAMNLVANYKKITNI